MPYSKIVHTGNYLEIYHYEKRPAIKTGRKRKPRKASESSRDTKVDERRDDNMRRLRARFIRILRSNLAGNGKPAFVTLTMLECVSVEVGSNEFRKFLVRLRQAFGELVKVVGVPEFQKRGALHYHCLIWGLPQDFVEHEREYRAIQVLWGFGYVDCIPTDGSEKLANYVAKYMYKGMQDRRLRGKRAYYCTRNVVRPSVFTTDIPGTYVATVYPGDNVLIREHEYDTLWLGRCHYKLVQVNT